MLTLIILAMSHPDKRYGLLTPITALLSQHQSMLMQHQKNLLKILFLGNKMIITPGNLRSLYIFLQGVEPFNKWRSMPKVNDCVFEVSFIDPLDMDLGSYIYCDDKHHICVNSKRHSHLDSVVRTLSHEICHALRGKTKKYMLHDDWFLQRSAAVGVSLGYDPLEL